MKAFKGLLSVGAMLIALLVVASAPGVPAVEVASFDIGGPVEACAA